MEKNTGLHLTGPIIKEGFFPYGKKRFRYIQIPETITKQNLLEDAKMGASMFLPCIQEDKQFESRMTLVEADSYEDGLTAVSYLIGLRNEQKNSKKMEDEESQELRDEKSDEDSEETDDFFDDDAILDDDDDWYKSKMCAGIIHVTEMIHERHAGMRDAFGIGGYLQTVGAEDCDADRPYWRKEDLPNLIVVKKIINQDADTVIPKIERDAFEILQNVRHVYFLLVREEQEEDEYHSLFMDDIEDDSYGEEIEASRKKDKKIDVGIASFLIEYTADRVIIKADEKTRTKYYKNIFKECLKRSDLILAKSFPIASAMELIMKLKKSDGSFADAVDKVLRFHRFQSGLSVKGKLTKKDFEKAGIFEIVDCEETRSNNDEEEKLIGMEEVKEKLDAILLMMKYVRLRKARNLSSVDFHNVHLFEGAPGTAKTTMAKILGRRMQEEKLLPGRKFISLTGAELKGKFVGHTAPKIHEIFKENDIIFIDEAYSIASGGNGELDSFSQEALAQLAVELENHASDKLIIFAGYGGKGVSEKNNKMKEFLDANPGIRSRINTTVSFESYTPQEMLCIIRGIAESKGYVMNEGANGEIIRFFEERVEDPNFGNGREARCFVEACELSMAKRVMSLPEAKQTDKVLSTIEKEDILSALLEKRRELGTQDGVTKVIGFAV